MSDERSPRDFRIARMDMNGVLLSAQESSSCSSEALAIDHQGIRQRALQNFFTIRSKCRAHVWMRSVHPEAHKRESQTVSANGEKLLQFADILPADSKSYDKMKPPKKDGRPTTVHFHVTVMGLDSINEESMTDLVAIEVSTRPKLNRIVPGTAFLYVLRRRPTGWPDSRKRSPEFLPDAMNMIESNIDLTIFLMIFESIEMDDEGNKSLIKYHFAICSNLKIRER
ncbi:hypothetical protein TNCV_2132111 [Trichonephila clavipes]|nr:hypothetical protein TNCV_2132111 [Trichonephila clavipes]